MSAQVPGPALLFCPADRPDRVLRAQERADGVIVDLEDAILPDHKDQARGQLREVAGELDPERALVRVNAAGSEWIAGDVEAVRGCGLGTVMLPKAESPADVEALAPLRVVALCETAAGVLAAPQIAAASNCVGLMWGGEDLIADIGGRSSRRPDGRYYPAIVHVRSRVLLAAGAAKVAAIDAIHVSIDAADDIRAEAAEAAAIGFDAKACIHPKQVQPIREGFRPSPAELEWARGVLAAAEEADGVFAYEGRMVDEPLLRHARSLIAIASQEEE